VRPSVLVMMVGLLVGATAHARSTSDSGTSPEDTASQDSGDTATPTTTATTGATSTTGSKGTTMGTVGGTEPTTFPGADGYTAADLAGEPGGAPAVSLGCGGGDDNNGKAALWFGLPLVIGLRRR